MPLDIHTFKVRALSAVVFGIIMLIALLGGAWPFLLVFGIISFIGAKEYFDIQSAICKAQKDDTTQLIYALSMVITYLAIALSGNKPIVSILTKGSAPLWFGAVVLLLFWMAMAKHKLLNIRLLAGLFYIALAFGLFAHCYAIHPNAPLYIIILIWINDTMQYIVGSLIGKHKMAPIISPKKTWEGTIGGSLLCVLVAISLSFLLKDLNFFDAIVFGLIAAVAGTLGDLLESKMKRSAGIKDSGNIMPGHGGVLDRFDSLLVCATLLFIYLFLKG